MSEKAELKNPPANLADRLIRFRHSIDAIRKETPDDLEGLFTSGRTELADNLLYLIQDIRTAIRAYRSLAPYLSAGTDSKLEKGVAEDYEFLGEVQDKFERAGYEVFPK